MSIRLPFVRLPLALVALLCMPLAWGSCSEQTMTGVDLALAKPEQLGGAGALLAAALVATLILRRGVAPFARALGGLFAACAAATAMLLVQEAIEIELSVVFWPASVASAALALIALDAAVRTGLDLRTWWSSTAAGAFRGRPRWLLAPAVLGLFTAGAAAAGIAVVIASDAAPLAVAGTALLVTWGLALSPPAVGVAMALLLDMAAVAAPPRAGGRLRRLGALAALGGAVVPLALAGADAGMLLGAAAIAGPALAVGVDLWLRSRSTPGRP